MVWAVRLKTGKHKVKKKYPEGCLEGRKGRRGKAYRKVGNFQTAHRLSSTTGKKPQDFLVPKI